MNAIIERKHSTINLYKRVRYPILVVLSGPSGVGKDTIVQAIMERNENLHFVVTTTTRPPREGEVNGVDYFFVSEQEFARMIERDELLEHAIVHDNYKGVPKQQIRDALNSGKDVIMRVDPQGAATIKRLVPNALFVFLMAESEEALIERLRRRKSESVEGLQLRIEIARKELTTISNFDFCVVNYEGQLDLAVSQFLCIIESQKLRAVQEPITL